MTFTVKISSSTNGIPLPGLSKEKADEIVQVLSGLTGIHRITMTWDQVLQPTAVSVETTYPEQECAITDYPIASIEEIKPKPTPKKVRKKKQTLLEKEDDIKDDDDADYKNQLKQNTRLGDGGDYANESGQYEGG